MGQRYLPTQIQILNFEHDHTMHQKKLEEIQQIEAKKKAAEKDGTSKKQLSEVRERNLKFHNSEKALAIEKDNQLLLGKLVEISRKKKPNLFPLKNDTNHPKTLNGPSRRREKDRIAQENEAFARRLLSQQPSFNRRKLETDYERHNDRVKNMQRLAGLSPRVRKVKLPPLTRDDTNAKTLEDKRGRTNDEKKNTNQITKVQEEHEGDVTEEEDTKAELAAQKQQAELERQEKEKKDQEEKARKDNEAAAQAKAQAEADDKAKAQTQADAKVDHDTVVPKQEKPQEQNIQSASVQENQVSATQSPREKASPSPTQQGEIKVEQKSAEQKSPEPQSAEQKSAEQKPAEQQSAEQKPAEQKSAEQKPVEQQSAEQKPAEQQSAEQRKSVANPDSQRASVVSEQKGNAQTDEVVKQQ